MSKLEIRDLGGKKRRVDVLYEDEHLLVLNKPAPVLTLPDRWDPRRPNLVSLLKKKLKDVRPYVVHRLDAGTSGVVVFAKTAEAHRGLNRQFSTNRVRKTYWAIVSGAPPKERGKIEKRIAEDPRRPGRVVISKSGKDAVTHYRILERFVDFTLVELRPVTGRSHQLRVHLQWLGCPIATDPDYGGRQALYLSEFKPDFRLDEDEREYPFISRPSLHAVALEIEHPISGEPLRFEAELPKDFRTFLRILRSYRPYGEVIDVGEETD